MAWNNVTCVDCGCESRIQLYGKMSGREWMAEHWICDDCKKKALEETNAKAVAENLKNGLPTLTGSDKQIAWAETIRKDLLQKIEIDYRMSVERINNACPEEIVKWKGKEIKVAGILNATEECARIALESIKAKTLASWWIDNRFGISFRRFVEDAIQAEKIGNAENGK